MNQDPFVHQDLPHSNHLTSRLQAVALLHQPVDQLFAGAALPGGDIHSGGLFAVVSLNVEAVLVPVGLQVVLPITDQTRVLLNHDAVNRSRGLYHPI